MAAIALVTDSTANMPDELARRYEIAIVPTYVVFGDESLRDYVELPPAEFYRRLAEIKAAGGKIPGTSQPAPADFDRTYHSLADAGATDILSIHIGSKLSGTFNSARVASEAFTGPARVHLVDTGTLSMQMSYMILEAAEAIRSGGGISEALDAVEKVKANSCTYMTIAEVEHLEASGRVEGKDKVVEAAIQVRPVIGMLEGLAKVVGTERAQRAAIDKVIELTCNRMRGLELKGVSVVHTNSPERAEALKARVPAELGYDGEIHVVDLGPGLAVHLGPGVVGLAAYGE